MIDAYHNLLSTHFISVASQIELFNTLFWSPQNYVRFFYVVVCGVISLIYELSSFFLLSNDSKSNSGSCSCQIHYEIYILLFFSMLPKYWMNYYESGNGKHIQNIIFIICSRDLCLLFCDIIHINRLTLAEKSPSTQSFLLTYQHEFESLVFGRIFFV